ncbi:MAG: hypothetical protein GC206_04435 [Alphaproteobacteria bacterium]|nr:hypothetical protein [Alphaproteobacteria bacterium]
MSDPERRSFNLLRESASTTRVLDLATVVERFGDTPEWKAAPFFFNERLNRTIILKHALRPNERSIFRTYRRNATKIVFPYTVEDLSLGGEVLFIGEPGFERAIATKVMSRDAAELQPDIDLLELLDTLPSFDPFLLRERLRQFGREPARCYFEISAADTARMTKFVSDEIASLVDLAVSNQKEPSAPWLARRLADKLMTDETAESLSPLRTTLHLSGDAYREGVFAWKGFLYYKWTASEWASRLPDLTREILTAAIRNVAREDLAAINVARKRIVNLLTATVRDVQASLQSYDSAYRQLAAGKPTAFRDFLIEAPKMFTSIGEAVGVIKHIDSFWRFRFPQGRLPVMEGFEAMDLFQDFEATLSGLHAPRAPAP